MTDFLHKFIFSNDFMLHGHCYLWRPGLVWIHALSDSAIAASYVGISLTLVYLVKRAKGDLPLPRIFLFFGAFIIFCGLTHLMDVWNLWNGDYWLAGGVKVVTAAASAGTAMILPPIVPKILQMVEAARKSEE